MLYSRSLSMSLLSRIHFWVCLPILSNQDTVYYNLSCSGNSWRAGSSVLVPTPAAAEEGKLPISALLETTFTTKEAEQRKMFRKGNDASSILHPDEEVRCSESQSVSQLPAQSVCIVIPTLNFLYLVLEKIPHTIILKT